MSEQNEVVGGAEGSEGAEITAILNGVAYRYPAGRDENYIRNRLLQRDPTVANMVATWTADRSAVTFSMATSEKGV